MSLWQPLFNSPFTMLPHSATLWMSSGQTTIMDSVPCGDVVWSKGDDLSCTKGYIAWAEMSEIGEPNIFWPPNPTHSLLLCGQKILCRRFDSLLATCDNWKSLKSSAPMPAEKSVMVNGACWRQPHPPPPPVLWLNIWRSANSNE